MRWTSASSWVPSTSECEARDLFDERRAGPRQPQDEDGIRVGDAPAPASVEEFPCAHPLRLPDVSLGKPGQVTNFRVLERIAALVVRPRAGVVIPVFQCLAEREAQVAAIYEGCCGCTFRRAHARDVVEGKAIRLEVRETPPGLARFRPGADGGTVLLDRLRQLTLGSQGERDPHVQLCGLLSRSGVAQQPTVQADPGLIVTQPDAGLSVLPEVCSVARIELEQPLDLLARPHIFVLIQQRPGVVGTRRAVAGDPSYDCF